MTALIKDKNAIAKMRIAGRLAAEVLEMLTPQIKIGMTTDEINDICHKHITEVQHAIPAPLNYKGFPKSVCTSINHVICHGIPSDKKLKDGDIINVDVTVIKDGYHGDTSKMFLIGNVAPRTQELVKNTQKAMYLGIEQVKPGAKLGDIGAAIQNFAHSHNYSIVREFCGHGIGLGFHEDPQVLHYGKAGTGETLEAGMIFTIEPMINLGKRHMRMLGDGWTAITKDRKPSAQWEHTILVTDNGYEILTLREEEKTSYSKVT